MFAVWCTGERELYDLKKDPHQLHNLYDNRDQNIQLLLDRLDALLAVLKSCRGHTCRNPWRVLHPDNPSIETLDDALDAQVIYLFIGHRAYSLVFLNMAYSTMITINGSERFHSVNVWATTLLPQKNQAPWSRPRLPPADKTVRNKQFSSTCSLAGF